MLFNGSLRDDSQWDGSITTDSLAVNVSNFTNHDDVFEHLYVRIPLIVAYTIVFLCCFFGNLMVIVVVMVHRRMRTATNFFLANLALADFCVGIFCVYQNLLSYLTHSWGFGDFLCRMYHFIEGLSYTASILILTIISIERYVVIVHPMWGRRFITMRRLRIVLGVLWLLSAVYNCPRLIFFRTITTHSLDDDYEYYTYCIYLRSHYNSKQFEICNFVFLFVFPMIVMGVLYTSIGFKLWRSEKLHGEKTKNCFLRLCRKKRRRRIPKPLLRIIKTPPIQTSITHTLSREGSLKEPTSSVPKPEVNITVSEGLPYLDSSCEEEDEHAKQNNMESLRSLNTIRSSIVRQSSFRSGSTRRPNGNIKFAEFDSENSRLSSCVPPHVPNPLQRTSGKFLINDKDCLQDSKVIQDSECKDDLLLNQLSKLTGQFGKILNESDVPTILPTGVTNAIFGTASESVRSSFKRYIIRSVSQHSHQTDGAATPVQGDSIRNSITERPDYIDSVSQRSQNEESSAVMKKKTNGKIRRKGSKILRSRRKIIRLLIAILCMFATCNLPYHARKLWQMCSPSYDGSQTITFFLTISTTLVLYMNSGFNPFLYAFLSANFRKSIKDVVLCNRHLWSTHIFSPNASNNSRLTSSSSGPISQGSSASAVSNF